MSDEILILENNGMLIYSEPLTVTEGDFPVSPVLRFLYSAQLNKDPAIRNPKHLLYIETHRLQRSLQTAA